MGNVRAEMARFETAAPCERVGTLAERARGVLLGSAGRTRPVLEGSGAWLQWKRLGNSSSLLTVSLWNLAIISPSPIAAKKPGAGLRF